MRLNFVLAGLFFSSALWVLAEQSELSRQSELHQMFLLRDALIPTNAARLPILWTFSRLVP